MNKEQHVGLNTHFYPAEPTPQKPRPLESFCFVRSRPGFQVDTLRQLLQCYILYVTINAYLNELQI